MLLWKLYFRFILVLYLQIYLYCTSLCFFCIVPLQAYSYITFAVISLHVLFYLTFGVSISCTSSFKYNFTFLFSYLISYLGFINFVSISLSRGLLRSLLRSLLQMGRGREVRQRLPAAMVNPSLNEASTRLLGVP